MMERMQGSMDSVKNKFFTLRIHAVSQALLAICIGIKIRVTIVAAVLTVIVAGCGKVSEKKTDQEYIPLPTARESETEIKENEPDAGKSDSVDEENEFFNSMGVATEILSEGEWLTQEVHDDFLKKYGFGECEPFYVYRYADGDLDVELYYDPDRSIGCGFKYWENASGPVVCGYAFNQCDVLSWYNPDPFSCVSSVGITGKEFVKDYREEYEYDEEGKLTGFCSTGRAEEDDPGEPPATLVNISFLYDESGALKERVYSHNSGGRYPFGTFLSSQHSYYDKNMRLLYTASYTTSGSLDSYYIYEEDMDTPSYYFELQNQYTSWPVLYQIQQNNHNWTCYELEQEPKEGYSSEEEFMTEAEWLAYQGYTEENLFYEHEYYEGNEAAYGLTLYCDENMERGGGILKIYGWKRTRKFGYTFEGRERYLSYPIGPWNVFSYFYSDGRNIVFLEGETITEYFKGLEETYGQPYAEFGYEGERLMYMIEDRPHGGEWRFYIYGEESKEEPEYLLEIDPGWGITFYSF